MDLGSSDQTADCSRPLHDQEPTRSDTNNNHQGITVVTTSTEDLYSPSSSSSDRESQLSPENYPDEEFYGKLKVKVQRDGKKMVEKKRRQDLQQQYSNLRMLLPGLQDMEGRTPLSRSIILKNARNYIEQLKVCTSSSLQLANELRLQQEYNQRLVRELKMWQEKVDDLRKKKQKSDFRTGAHVTHIPAEVPNSMTSPHCHSKLIEAADGMQMIT